MKNFYVIAFFVLTVSNKGNSQTFMSDSISRFSISKNEIIETLPDTTYTIERTFKTITVVCRVEGFTGVKSRGISETRWTIQIEKKSLAIPRGNTKSQIIEGMRLISGIRQYVTVAYDLVDRNNDGDYESLEYTMREGTDIELSIYCHKK